MTERNNSLPIFLPVKKDVFAAQRRKRYQLAAVRRRMTGSQQLQKIFRNYGKNFPLQAESEKFN